MAEASRFWTTTGTGDGPAGGYTAAQFAEFVRQTLMTDTLTEGVLKGIGNELAVTSASASVNVATGAGLVYGAFYSNDATVNIAVTNTAASTRIDRIVLRANFSPTTGDLPQTIRIKKSDGVAGTGVPPALVQSSTGIFEIPLATVSVSAGGGTITVTDARTFVKTPGTYGYLDDSNIINAAQLASNSVTTAKILDANVTADKLASSAATEAKIATGAVTEAKIGTGAVTSGKIGANAVVSGKIAADAVTTAAILNGTVTADKLVSSAVIESKIATGAVTVDKIGAGAVISSKIATTSVTGGTTGNIALTTITADNLASNSVTADKILSSAVTTVKIADDAVTSAKIAPNTIAGGALGNIALTTITADNLASNAVTADKILSNAVTADKILSSAVTTMKIADLAVTGAKIANTTVTDSKISSLAWSKLTGVPSYISTLSRQGGSPTAWATAGTNDYDISALVAPAEVGSIALVFSSSTTATATVTFSVGFAYLPIVYVTSDTSSLDAMITVSARSINPGNFTVKAYSSTALTGSVFVYWMAIGRV